MSFVGVRFASIALVVLACAATAIALGGPERSVAAEAQGPLHVYVVVVDGLRPEEVNETQTPTLHALQDAGTWYAEARAIFPAETLPNHVAMATGTLPTRNGIIGNQFWRPDEGQSKEYMEHPGLIQQDTIVTRLERACTARGGDVATATVLSKTYLYNAFRGEPAGSPVNSSPTPAPAADDPNPQREADFHWRAPSYIPVSDHAPDTLTMNAFLDWLGTQPADLPQFAFVNLGDVDRAGHADEAAGLSFGQVTPFRDGAIQDTDTQLDLLRDRLETLGTWDDTVMIVLSDHGMDYGPQSKQLLVAPALQDAGYSVSDSSYSDAHVVGGGGSGLVWVADKKDIAPMAKALADAEAEDGTKAVEFISVREPIPTAPGEEIQQTTHAQMGFDNPRAPDIEVFVKPGYHVGDGSNVLPGNHAHTATQHSALIVTGGHPLVRQGVDVGGDPVYAPNQHLFAAPAGGPGVLSVAPTVAEVFGIGAPPDGYDGSPLSEALNAEQLPDGPVCGTAQPVEEQDDDSQRDGETAAPGDRSGGGGGGQATGPSRYQTSGIAWTDVRASRTRVRAGRRVKLSGRVLADRGCSGPFRVIVRKRPRVVGADRHAPAGAAATSVRAGPDGRWRLRIRATRTVEYAAKVQPTRTCGSGTAVTTVVEVAARVDVFVPRPCRPGRVVSGRVRPSQPGTRILLQRRAGSRWITVARERVGHHSEFAFRLPACSRAYRVLWPDQGVVSLRGSRRFRTR